jgi:6-phosphogluconolactonase
MNIDHESASSGEGPEVLYLQDFATEAAAWIAAKISAAQAGGGLASLSLCGGATPRPVYELLAVEPGIDWRRLRVTFGDERCVPPGDPQSNYRMAREALLDRVPVAAGNVLRLAGEDDPENAARAAEAVLRRWAAEAGKDVFRHDLVLLGVGDDGHTASLFPGTPALDEGDRWVMPNPGPGGSRRLTFTYPILNAAVAVAFLVNGENKRPVVERILDGSTDPAARVRPSTGTRTWLLGGFESAVR